MAIIIIQGEKEKALNIHYEVDTSLPPIGVGGMGQVFRGFKVDDNTGVKVPAAIKFLFDDLPASAVERSRREASVQIQSENLVEMFGFIEVEGTDANGNQITRYHVASELLDGVMLHDLLRGRVTNAAGETLPYAEEMYLQYSDDRLRFAVHIVRSLLSGIMALHDGGFIHRDIDPSNVMITAQGKVKLIDFGICKNLNDLGGEDRHLTSAGQFMGKAAYASPELVTGDVAHQDATTDLYAVGIMFYELLTGKLPFDGPTHEVLEKQLKAAVPVKNISDKYARKIIQKATAKKQTDRYATAAEFRVAVEQLSRNSVSGGSVSKSPTGTNPGVDVPLTTGSGTPAVKPEKNEIVTKVIKLIKDNKYVAVGGAAVLALAIIIMSVIAARDNEQEELNRVAEEARIQAIEQRTAELQGAIIDSPDEYVETDTLTGIEVPSAGYLIKRARGLLANASTASQGVRILKDVAAKGYKSAAPAYALLGALNGRSPGLGTEVLDATENAFPRDFNEAHRLNEMAVSQDSTCFIALYELGCDYLAGDARGVVPRDLDVAHEYLVKGLKNASAVNDTTYMRLFEERLKIFE